MSPAHVLEPTYQNLKRGLMQGNWRPGERLEALRLADEFGVSMTPVRDCLNRLVGEALVDMIPGDGYRVPRISEKMLRDMLGLHAILLEFALLHPSNVGEVPLAEHSAEDYAGRVAALFGVIAQRSANIALVETLLSFSERLHAVRRWEPQLFSDCVQEAEELERKLTGNTNELIVELRKYHERRIENVAELIELAQS